MSFDMLISFFKEKSHIVPWSSLLENTTTVHDSFKMRCLLLQLYPIADTTVFHDTTRNSNELNKSSDEVTI